MDLALKLQTEEYLHTNGVINRVVTFSRKLPFNIEDNTSLSFIEAGFDILSINSIKIRLHICRQIIVFNIHNLLRFWTSRLEV